MATKNQQYNNEDQSKERVIPNFDDDTSPAPVYLDLMVRVDSPQSIPITASFAAPYNRLRLGKKSFQISWLKRSLVESLHQVFQDNSERLGEAPEIKKIDFTELNLVYKGKILLDNDNIFNAGIKEGSNVNLIYKTNARKVVEEMTMDHSKKYLTKEEGRGNEQKVEPSARQKKYQENIFGLSETKFEMLIDTMLKNPILIVRYSENKMVQRLIDDKEIKDEITKEIPYFRNMREKSPRFDKMISGNGNQDLNNCKSFISDTGIIRPVVENMENSTHNLLTLCDYVVEPDTHLNPMENAHVMKNINGQNPLADNMVDADDAMHYKKTTATTSSNTNEPKGIRPDLKTVFKKYQPAFEQLKGMGFDDPNKILSALDQASGDVNQAINYYIEMID